MLAALQGSTAAHVAAAVQVDGLGRTVDVNGLAMLPPASTQKVYTAAAALLRLGPTHRLRTEVRATGSLLEGGILAGDLVLVGGGDPTITGNDLQRMAFEVAGAGVTRVAGWLYGDDTRYDRRRGAAGWKAGWVGDESPPLSAIVVDRNRWRRDAEYLANPVPANVDRFRVALERAGVTVAGPTTVGTPPMAPGELVAFHESPPVGALVGRMLKSSDNFVAELLLKELGVTVGEPTSMGGVAAIWKVAAAFGMGPGQAVDGSGLSAHDRSAPWHQVDWLVNVSRTDVADHLRHSLPLACGDGTLRQRFCATAAAGKVFAKTGTLNGVVTLAGYTTTASGRAAWFSFELAGVSSTAAARAAIDRAVIAVVGASG